MAFEWDCDCGWELDFDAGAPPPLFELPPPPVPPSLQATPELCAPASAHPLGLETCAAFLISDAEYREPAKVADWMPLLFASAAALTVVFIAVLVWRYKKQKEEQQAKTLLRCQQKTLNGAEGLGDPRLTRLDDCDADSGAFYDELISYPTHFRPVVRPPAYEMKDVLHKSSANSSPSCHCAAHPLLPRVQPHYVQSPYPGSGGSHSPPTSSTPTAEADCSWTAEPVYEELPSGPDEEMRFNQRNGGSVVRKPSKASTNSSGLWSDEPCETDSFLAPSTWYRQPHANASLIRGQLTAQGPVRQGRGGIRAAWRELEQPVAQPQTGANHAGRKKRKVKSTKSEIGREELPDESPTLHYHSAGLYRGRCPPEEPPFGSVEADDAPPMDDPAPIEQTSTPAKTLPRYYYYSESDDYGVGGQKRTLSSIRRNNQRHLARHPRTQQQVPAADNPA